MVGDGGSFGVAVKVQSFSRCARLYLCIAASPKRQSFICRFGEGKTILDRSIRIQRGSRQQMRKTNCCGGFLPCLLINIVLNFAGIIPAAILFALHFLLGISVWWAVAMLALWILGILVWMLIMKWASRCGNMRDPEKPNKNPYSVGNEKYRAFGEEEKKLP